MKKALVAALVAATFIAPAGAFAQVGGESGDERIVAAREALRKGDRDTLERLAAMRETHPLDAYPRYWLLINRLARADEPVPVPALQAFFSEEAGSNLAARLPNEARDERAEALRQIDRIARFRLEALLGG